MEPTRIMIVDDHAILRMGLSSLLGTKKDLLVVGDAASGETAIRKALRLQPDVVLMDLMMPGMDGVETTRRLLDALPKTRILILTTFGTADGISRALEAGACGAIMKNIPFDALVTAIRKAAAGERVVSEEISRILDVDPPIPPLSPRQREILGSIVRGLSNADIAVQLGISRDVVKEHAKTLFGKIGAANRVEAVAIALRKHLLDG